MAVRSTQRPRVLLQRGFDAVAELSDLIASKISAATDPRARLLRRRRRALRWAVIFSAGCLFWAALTAVLAAWGWFVLLLQITGAIAVVQAIPATLLFFRYFWLRSEPLPAQRPAITRRLPPPGSAARPAMSALGASERGFFSLLGVIERGAMLPAAEIGDLAAAAHQTSAAMAATAAEVVSMERAAHDSASSRPYLVPTINAFTAQLGAGVRQYNGMVTAAAQLVSSANGETGAGRTQQRYREELADATDRLMGWAQAFDELGGLPGH
ncbi:hypothetical protein H7H78_01835 [Mycobacterium shinjukuense]|uniref:Uncharacterized protein n=1 Tax=Mycobacterium shinjukuense TaxID=398694 RepID=A0A7I7MSF6_9MYCO|nr:hypothetical protein [Mycobacterium shinjukuense]MCV6984235.1 hypothetical protein [Mycobacterium shinjukuense]ORB70195.1 hypothetical protein BST45_06650 [Mycobacterium shinjukuense]BBX74189.1 hypothetical protein MSHI_20950 [Mycobacterium shinjukuense]